VVVSHPTIRSAASSIATADNRQPTFTLRKQTLCKLVGRSAVYSSLFERNQPKCGLLKSVMC
jgi:hypothetical protein